MLAATASDKPDRDMVVVAGAVCILLRVPSPSWPIAREVMRTPLFVWQVAQVRRSQLKARGIIVAKKLLRQCSSAAAPLY